MVAIAIRKAQPTPGDVHVDRPLTMISVGWIQRRMNYVAGRVFPTVGVPKQSDKYFVFSRADWLRARAEKRAPSTESAGGGFGLSTASYACDVWAFHKDVSDQIRANSDTRFNADRSGVQFATQACMTAKEVEWASNYFTTGVWTGSSTGTDITPGTLWDAANSTPIADIRAQIYAILGKTGYMPNKLVLGAEVWLALQDNADIVDRVNAGQTPGGPAMVSLQRVASILELEEIVVAKAVQNSGPEGGTESTDFILGSNDALLCYATPAPAIDQPTAGYTFAWTGYFGAGAEGNRIKRIRAELIESDRIECEMAFDQKVVAPELGAFFSNAVT